MSGMQHGTMELLSQAGVAGADIHVPPKTVHYHCVHPFSGVLHMVLPPGHTVVQCCECGLTFTHHAGHRWAGTSEPCSRGLMDAQMKALGANQDVAAMLKRALGASKVHLP